MKFNHLKSVEVLTVSGTENVTKEHESTVRILWALLSQYIDGTFEKVVEGSDMEAYSSVDNYIQLCEAKMPLWDSCKIIEVLEINDSLSRVKYETGGTAFLRKIKCETYEVWQQYPLGNSYIAMNVYPI